MVEIDGNGSQSIDACNDFQQDDDYDKNKNL